MGSLEQIEDPTQLYEPEEPIFITPQETEETFVEDEIGLQLSHLLALGGTFLLLIMLISVLWNYCAGDEQQPPSEPAPEPKKAEQVVVAEVRPGLILIRGSPTSEETFRILQEYDALSQQAAMGRPPPHDATPYYGSTGGRDMYDAAAGHPFMVNPGDSQLIDLEADGRPPPYAPPFPTTPHNPH